jgi:hypothetical protein
MAIIETTSNRKRDLLSAIVIWLYTHDGAYENRTEWRKALIEFLEQTI